MAAAPGVDGADAGGLEEDDGRGDVVDAQAAAEDVDKCRGKLAPAITATGMATVLTGCVQV